MGSGLELRLASGHHRRTEPVVQPATSEEKEVALMTPMRRIFILLTVVAFVVTTVSVYAMVAIAQGKSEAAPNCEQGIVTSLGQTPNASLESTTQRLEQLADCATPPGDLLE